MSQATMKVQPKTKDQQTGAHAVLTARRIVAYAVLILLCALCLFFFYVLIINATRPHADIQKGFSFLPGSWTSLCNNFTQVINNANIPIISGMRNSLIVSAMTAIFACYFSALTAFGIHAYRFKGRALALTFILLIMTMPTQVSALGFVQLMGKMNLKDSLLPLFLPVVGPFYKGLSVTVPLHLAQLSAGASAERIHAAFAAHYAGERFVRVMPLNDAATMEHGFFDVQGCNDTNRVDIFVFANGDQVLLMSRLDNLGKGASGAAVQSMNVHLGVDEGLGL